MAVTSITAYQADDGSIFDNEDDALAHDRESAIKNRLERHFDMFSVYEFGGEPHWTFEILYEQRNALLKTLSGRFEDDV